MATPLSVSSSQHTRNPSKESPRDHQCSHINDPAGCKNNWVRKTHQIWHTRGPLITTGPCNEEANNTSGIQLKSHSRSPSAKRAAAQVGGGNGFNSARPPHPKFTGGGPLYATLHPIISRMHQHPAPKQHPRLRTGLNTATGSKSGSGGSVNTDTSSAGCALDHHASTDAVTTRRRVLERRVSLRPTVCIAPR